MYYLENYGMRDYSRCDYERLNNNDVNFDKVSREVKKFGGFKNVKFYVTEGPANPRQVGNYIDELSSHKITFLARTNHSNYDSSAFQSTGISLVDLSFRPSGCPPEEHTLKEFHDAIKNFYQENKRVVIAIQGYEEGAFMIAFALMVMGMTRLKALEMIRAVDGEVTNSQNQYLHWREDEFKEDHEFLHRRRRPNSFFARCIHYLFDASR